MARHETTPAANALRLSWALLSQVK